MSSTASGAAARSVAANDAFARPGRSAGGCDGRRPSSSSSGSVDPAVRACARGRRGGRRGAAGASLLRLAVLALLLAVPAEGEGRSKLRKLRGAIFAPIIARAGGALALLLAVLRELELALLLREEAASRRRAAAASAAARPPRWAEAGRRRRRRCCSSSRCAASAAARTEAGDPPHAAAHGLVEAEQRVLQVEAAEPRWVRLPRVACAPAALANACCTPGGGRRDGGDRELGGRVGPLPRGAAAAGRGAPGGSGARYAGRWNEIDLGEAEELRVGKKSSF